MFNYKKVSVKNLGVL